MHKELAIAQAEIGKVFNGRFDSTDPDHPLGISLVLSGDRLKADGAPVYLALTKIPESGAERESVERQVRALQQQGINVPDVTKDDVWGLAMSPFANFGTVHWISVSPIAADITNRTIAVLREFNAVAA